MLFPRRCLYFRSWTAFVSYHTVSYRTIPYRPVSCRIVPYYSQDTVFMSAAGRQGLECRTSTAPQFDISETVAATLHETDRFVGTLGQLSKLRSLTIDKQSTEGDIDIG